MAKYITIYYHYCGLPRDYLLGFKIKDIDINIDTHELDKIFYNHIYKYHQHETGSSPSKTTTHNCFFMDLFHKNQRLNPLFFVNVLINDELLTNKFKINSKKWKIDKHEYTYTSIDDKREIEWHQLIITKDLVYNDMNLKGNIIEITDCSFTNMSNLSVFTQKEFKFNQYNKLNNDEYAKFVYKFQFKNRLTGTDFSINSFFIIFNDIMENDKIVIHSPHEIDDKLYNDSFYDIDNCILNTPIKNYCIYTMNCHFNKKHGYKHFWRTIKFMVKFDNKWNINDELFKHTIDFYKIWINKDTMNNEKDVDNLVWHIVNGSFIKDELEDNIKKFKAMDILKFHHHTVPFLKINEMLGEKLMNSINSKNNDKVIQLFNKLLSQYNYF